MEVIAVRQVRIPVGNVIATESTHAGRCVLLVTGDGDLRAVATRVLERDGYDVIAVAHSGHAVLACLTAPRIDALATELSMDDTSGPALAERLRRHHPEIRAVYFGQPGSSECDDVLVRPFSGDDLLAKLEVLVTARV